MAIQIVHDKLSAKANDAINKRQSSVDLCIRTISGCRIGLPAAFYNWKDLSFLNDNRITIAELATMGGIGIPRYCEDGTGTHFVARGIADLQANLSKQCDVSNPIGGWPKPKNIVEQLVDGLYKLATTNPAIVACLMVSGPSCPLIQVLLQSGLTMSQINYLLDLWAGASAWELKNQVSTACNALGIKPQDCPTWIVDGIAGARKRASPTPPGEQPPPYQPLPTSGQDRIAIYVNDVMVMLATAIKQPDGSYLVANADLPIVGKVTFSIRFSDCSLHLQKASGVLQVGIYNGRPLSSQACEFKVGSYTVRLVLIPEGQQPPSNGMVDGNRPFDQDKEKWIIIGGLAFLAIVALIITSR